MKNIGGYSILVVTVLVLNMLVVLNLSAQTYMQYNMRKTYYVASEMVSEIERLGVDNEDYKLCVIGTMENGNYPDEQGKLKETEEVKETGNFPEENSVEIIGDIIVVKLADW